jgi:uncharacterized protein YceK
MKHPWTLFIASCMALAACSGCASISNHIPNEEPGVYSGVRQNVHTLVHPGGLDVPYGYVRLPLGMSVYMVTCCLIDLPFEVASDTLLLPIDLTYHKPKTSADGSSDN